MLSVVKDLTADWSRQPPASATVIVQLVEECEAELPGAYITFLSLSNGGEGTLGIEPGWFRVWSAEEVLEANMGYEVRNHLPNHFAFGTNGGGEMFAFDLAGDNPSKVYMIPFITMEAGDAILIADSFEDFVSAMGHDL
jgi:hypothetical protein